MGGSLIAEGYKPPSTSGLIDKIEVSLTMILLSRLLLLGLHQGGAIHE
jgi:hypothetical protein